VLPSGLLLALPAYAAEVEPAAAVGEPAFEEAVPDPETGLYPGQVASDPEFGPGSPGWITGFTEQEAQVPAAAPVAPKAATVKSAPKTTTQVRRTSTRQATGGSVTRSSGSSTAGPGEPTALPFTGGRLESQLAAGVALVVMGWLLLVVSRPRNSGSRRVTA